MTMASIGELAHHCHILEIGNDSYRYRFKTHSTVTGGEAASAKQTTA